jgi:ribose 1,5-bisphosphokinase PhnN
MYHIGIIQQVLSPGKGILSSDSSVQAVVKMWDENLLILGVEKKIARSIKKGDYVLADYSPVSAASANRKLSLIKLLPTEVGSKVWAEFQDEYDRRRAKPQQPPQPSPQQMRYIR